MLCCPFFSATFPRSLIGSLYSGPREFASVVIIPSKSSESRLSVRASVNSWIATPPLILHAMMSWGRVEKQGVADGTEGVDC